MNSNPAFSQEIIDDWLKEIEFDQQTLLSMESYARNILKINNPEALRSICLDGVQRLLMNKNVIALVVYVGEKTEVWDFSSEKALKLLQNHWEYFAPPKVRKGEPDFTLNHKKHISSFKECYPKPIIYMKEPPIFNK